MKTIHYNSTIAKIFTFIAGFKTIMLFGSVFTERDSLSKESQEHEFTHCKQYSALVGVGLFAMIGLLFGLLALDCVGWGLFALALIPVFLFYIWYGVEFLIKFCILLCRKMKFKKAWYEAYSLVSFEQEAVELAFEVYKPCSQRKEYTSMGFLKYVFKM